MGMNNDFLEQCCANCTDRNCSACISKMKKTSARRKKSSCAVRCPDSKEEPDSKDVP